MSSIDPTKENSAQIGGVSSWSTSHSTARAPLAVTATDLVINLCDNLFTQGATRNDAKSTDWGRILGAGHVRFSASRSPLPVIN
jgi:hypothetical protein